MCFGNKLAKRQARAAEAQATASATNDAYSAQAAAQAKDNAVALDAASKEAAAMLTTPVEKAEVQLSEDTPAAEIDPTTGRRRTTRSSFQMQRSSGINL
jgi:hypothetical protein